MSDSVISTQDINDHLLNTIQKIRVYLGEGNCTSFDDYRYFCGQINSLRTLANELDTLKLSD